MYFRRCLFYYLLISVAAFLAGRWIPKKWICWENPPFREFSFERGGRFYEAFFVQHWQKKLPDMSRIFPQWMPPKNMKGNYKERLPVMIWETCVAEWIHTALCLLGLYGLRLWPGLGGIVVTFVYVAVFNLPYIMIQRYNRPRLVRLYHRLYHHGELAGNAWAVVDCSVK